MRSLKRLFSGAAAATLILTALPIRANAAWKQDSVGWWYEEGNSWTTGWKQIGEGWYYFDNSGYMKTGWVAINGSWYYFKSNGEMVVDGIIDGYALGKDGKMISPDYYKTQVKLAEDQAISNAMNNSQAVVIEDVKKTDDSGKLSTEEVIKNIEKYQNQNQK